MGSRLTSQTDLNMVDELTLASYFSLFHGFKLSKRKNWVGPRKQELNYGSVGAALSEVNFILIIGYFRDSFSVKNGILCMWQ